MSTEKTIPLTALVLGAAGLIPFVAGASALTLGLPVPGLGAGEALARLVTIYGIAILSFLGGVRWGIALGFEDKRLASRDFIIAVVPALVGWGAAMLAPSAALWVLCVAFVLLGLLDYGLVCRYAAPEWYGRLRLALSAVAALALGVAAGAAG